MDNIAQGRGSRTIFSTEGGVAQVLDTDARMTAFSIYMYVCILKKEVSSTQSVGEQRGRMFFFPSPLSKSVLSLSGNGVTDKYFVFLLYAVFCVITHGKDGNGYKG